MERPSPITIAPGSLQDVLKLREVMYPGQVAAELARDDDTVRGALHLVAQLDGRPVGSVSIHPESAPPVIPSSAPGWYLTTIVTRPEVRAHGTGARLFVHAMDHVAEQGGGVIWGQARKEALRFYEKLGVQHTGVWINEGRERTYMWLDVDPRA
jgi:GNAT superfamily N-acetyltransferase